MEQGWTDSEMTRKAKVEAGFAVVASKRARTDNALRAWAKAQGVAVEIDRKTAWGNPYQIGRDGDRDTVCDKYAEHYLPRHPTLPGRIESLKGKVLLCWCHPERCHGDHLARLANETGRETMDRTRRVFEVEADRITGEWIREEVDTGRVTTEAEWNAQQDTEDAHFDYYDHWITDETGYQTGETERRAVVVRWID